MIGALLFGCVSLGQELRVFEAPAGKRYAVVNPGGEGVLPNGRLLTPKGKRLYTASNLWGVAVSPDGQTLVGSGDGELSIWTDLDLKVPTLRKVSRPKWAPKVVFSKDGSRAFESMGDNAKLRIYRTSDWSVERDIDLKFEQFGQPYWNDFVLDPDERYVIGVDVAQQRIATVDLKAGAVVRSVAAGREPYAIALASETMRAYVANIGLFDYSAIRKPRPGEGSPRGLSRPPFGFPSREAEVGVEFEGRFVDGLGSSETADAHSVWKIDVSDPMRPNPLAKVKTGILLQGPTETGKAVGGSAPNSLIVSGGRVFVSNGNNDTVQVLDANSMRILQTVQLNPSPLIQGLRGVIPSALVADEKKQRLYVCESGLNSVAVLDMRTWRIVGRIPTGWFPNCIAMSSDGKQLFIGSQKGVGRGPRGPLHVRKLGDERFGLPDMPGMIQRVDVPDDSVLGRWNQAVLRNNGIVQFTLAAGSAQKGPIARVAGKPSREIEHVVYIIKENHTFDGIFGGLKGSKSEPEYAEFGRNGWISERGKSERHFMMPNHWRLAEQFAICDNFYMEPQASGDGHRWLIGNYPSFWSSRVFYAGWAPGGSAGAKGRFPMFTSNGSIIPEDYLENGSMWDHFARGGVRFRNYGEGFEFPSSDEGWMLSKTGVYEVANYPMPKVLYDNTCFDFPVYNNNIPDIARVDWYIEDVRKNFRAKNKPLPQVTVIALCNDHGASANAKQGYPYVGSYMADNDLALGRLVEFLTQQPEWKKMAIFVTQDDSGGDNDSVDRHRSYVLAISPYAKRGYVGNVHTSLSSIVKTIYLTFGLPPNNQFDALATDLTDLFTSRANYAGYRHVPVDPRVFRPEDTFDPTDPKFERRRKEASPVKMDDPDWIEKMNRRASGDKDR